MSHRKIKQIEKFEINRKKANVPPTTIAVYTQESVPFSWFSIDCVNNSFGFQFWSSWSTGICITAWICGRSTSLWIYEKIKIFLDLFDWLINWNLQAICKQSFCSNRFQDTRKRRFCFYFYATNGTCLSQI